MRNLLSTLAFFDGQRYMFLKGIIVGTFIVQPIISMAFYSYAQYIAENYPHKWPIYNDKYMIEAIKNDNEYMKKLDEEYKRIQ